MKKQKGYAGVVIIIWLTMILVIGTGWVKNLIKLSECDFEAPYKAEIVHGVGLVPFIGMVTGWIDVGH